jgi:enoyl-[acyl-carrier protein] reductase I
LTIQKPAYEVAFLDHPCLAFFFLAACLLRKQAASKENKTPEVPVQIAGIYRPGIWVCFRIYFFHCMGNLPFIPVCNEITSYFYAHKNQSDSMSYNLLKGKKGIIFGALDEKSIAWKVAVKAVEEGALITLSNAPIALRMGKINELASICNAKVIAADATSVDDLEKLFKETMEILGGGLDFILHSIGMSPNVRKRIPYTDTNYDNFHKTLDVSALSFHKVMQTAGKLDAINEWGSVVALSYIAAQRAFPGYNDMADAKALLESIARSFGYEYGFKKKVRVNTVSQSPTMTTAGSGVEGFDAFFHYAEKISPLGNASAEACADYCVTLFSDYTRMVTMQNLFHDGGFSFTGVSHQIIEEILKNKQ